VIWFAGQLDRFSLDRYSGREFSGKNALFREIDNPDLNTKQCSYIHCF